MTISRVIYVPLTPMQIQTLMHALTVMEDNAPRPRGWPSAAAVERLRLKLRRMGVPEKAEVR